MLQSNSGSFEQTQFAGSGSSNVDAIKEDQKPSLAQAQVQDADNKDQPNKDNQNNINKSATASPSASSVKSIQSAQSTQPAASRASQNPNFSPTSQIVHPISPSRPLGESSSQSPAPAQDVLFLDVRIDHITVSHP